MDSGSERSYITIDLKERLRLHPPKKENINLNMFGGEQHCKKHCELVQIILQGQEEKIEIYALSYPTSCNSFQS